MTTIGLTGNSEQFAEDLITRLPNAQHLALDQIISDRSGMIKIRETPVSGCWVDDLLDVDCDFLIVSGVRFPNEVDALDFLVKVEEPLPGYEWEFVDADELIPMLMKHADPVARFALERLEESEGEMVPYSEFYDRLVEEHPDVGSRYVVSRRLPSRFSTIRTSTTCIPNVKWRLPVVSA